MMDCPHENIVHCPLYVAAHDPALSELGCTFAAENPMDGCAIPGSDYEAAVRELAKVAPWIVAGCLGKERHGRARIQRERNMRLNGIR